MKQEGLTEHQRVRRDSGCAHLGAGGALALAHGRGQQTCRNGLRPRCPTLLPLNHYLRSQQLDASLRPRCQRLCILLLIH